MYSVYIIYSQKLDKYYIGFSSNVDERLSNIIEILKDFLAPGRPWILMYSETIRVLKRKLWLEKINLKIGKTEKGWKV